jgi:hypothetical protein
MTEIPLIAEAPFHRPVTSEEVETILAEMDARAWTPGGFYIGDGWTLSFFRRAGETGPQAEYGWVKNDFAIYEASFRHCCKLHPRAELIHLTIGYRVGSFTYVEDAIEASEMLSAVLDWSEASHSALRAQRRKAYETLEQHFDLLSFGEKRIWTRRATVIQFPEAE